MSQSCYYKLPRPSGRGSINRTSFGFSHIFEFFGAKAQSFGVLFSPDLKVGAIITNVFFVKGKP
jgi:hypothetical protein